ncbi:MAG: hypothetical protein ACOCYW_04770 [Roseicyclus sp.]
MLSQRHPDREAEVVAQWRDLLERRLDREAQDGASFLDTVQNARLVRAAKQVLRRRREP